ncbi:Signal recognition particle 9 kDa protein [Spatholobus suberectus]|nr:Signal recognition particle 9 kDa protein [Spatholobus suberectus]
MNSFLTTLFAEPVFFYRIFVTCVKPIDAMMCDKHITCTRTKSFLLSPLLSQSHLTYKMFLKLIVIVFDQCLKYKTDQAQEAKKLEKLNNIFFTLMARGPEVDLSEVIGKEQLYTQTTKRGRGRKQ